MYLRTIAKLRSGAINHLYLLGLIPNSDKFICPVQRTFKQKEELNLVKLAIIKRTRNRTRRIWSISLSEQNTPPAPILLRILCKSSNFTGSNEEFTSIITSAPRFGTTILGMCCSPSTNLKTLPLFGCL